MITRRRLLALLPIPGIAIAGQKLLPRDPPPSAGPIPSATAHEIQPGRRYLLKLDRMLCVEDVRLIEWQFREAGIDMTVVNLGDFEIYDVTPKLPAPNQ